MSRSPSALLPFLLMGVFAASAARAADAEVRALLDQAGEAKDHGWASQVLVFDRTLNAAEENGRTTTVTRELVKILKPEGARERSVLSLHYDPLTSRTRFLQVRVHEKGGAVREVPLETTDLPAPAGIIFWGGRRQLLPVPGLEVGDGLEIVTERVGFKIAYLAGDEDDRYVPPMRGHFYDVVPFWTGTPTLEKTYVLDAPADKRVQFAVFQGALETSVRTEGDRALYTFTARDLKPFPGEPCMVSHWDVAPKLVLATVEDWPEKSRWFWKVNEPQFETDAAIRAKTDELLEGVEGEEARIRTLVHWVAEAVRYLGLSMGEGEGYTTHPATMTFRERAGVCKDKAGLLVAMLRHAGFDAYIVMTQVGSRVEAIAADQFNHAVTAVKRPDGRFLLLDPTWAPGSREVWSSLEQEQCLVVGTPEGETVGHAPFFPPEDNRLDGTSEVAVREDGKGGWTLEGRLTLEAAGYADTFFRRKLLRSPGGDRVRVVEELLRTALPCARIRELAVSDPADLSKPLRISVRWSADRSVLAGRGSLFVRSPCLGLLGGLPLADRLEEAAGPAERKHPFNLRNTIGVHLRETIEAPKGYRWGGEAGLAKPVEEAGSRADGTPGVTFRLARRVSGGALALELDVSVHRKEQPPEVQAGLRRVVEAARDAAARWFEAKEE